MKKLNITIEGTYCDGEEFIKTVKDPALVPNIIKEINETDNNKCESIEKNKTELLELISKFKDELLEYTNLTTIDFELKFVEEEGMFTDKKELIIYMSCDKGKYYVGCMDELEEILSKYTNGKITKITIYDEKFGDTVYPHVDHQSIGTLEFFLKDNNITLEEFICDPKYIVIIDKDGAGVLYNLKIVGMIKEQYK